MMKIHLKMSETYKKEKKKLSSSCYSLHGSVFLGILCFVSGCGNPLVGHFLISKGQDWS